MGGLPLGKFSFLHFVVLVSMALSSSFWAPAFLIAERTAFPHVRDLWSESWFVVLLVLLFQVKIVFPLGVSQRRLGLCVFVVSSSSVSCDVRPYSARESAASLRGSARWALIFTRKVLAPAVTRS